MQTGWHKFVDEEERGKNREASCTNIGHSQNSGGPSTPPINALDFEALFEETLYRSRTSPFAYHEPYTVQHEREHAPCQHQIGPVTFPLAATDNAANWAHSLVAPHKPRPTGQGRVDKCEYTAEERGNANQATIVREAEGFRDIREKYGKGEEALEGEEHERNVGGPKAPHCHQQEHCYR